MIKAYVIVPFNPFSDSLRRVGFSETRIAPVLLSQDREMLPPSHGTGYERYSPSFR